MASTTMGRSGGSGNDEELASHIEVCCRVRPLTVSETSSSDFFKDSMHSSNSTSSNSISSSNVSTPRTTSRLRKPQIPSIRKSSLRPSPGNINNNNISEANNNTYAWDVVSSDTVQQSSQTDIIPGRTFQYTLDKVYGPQTSTRQLYEQSVQDRVLASMRGYHAAILAYGQTSTGKTHSMSGTSQQPGLIPLSIKTCFQYLQQEAKEAREYLLRISYLEVYKEHIRDLLATSVASPPVRLFDSADGLVIKNLQEHVVTSAAQVFDILKQGERRRQVGATHLNQHSSRSHVMVRLWIESKAASDQHIRVSTLSLVDLAGSESVRLTGSSERRQEGHYINQSLMTLGKVVNSLSEGTKLQRKHVPYRDSKLTRLLQPSLSGQAQVVLLCCISPQVSHLEESHNTFKFATRAKKIEQKATIQSSTSDEKTLLQSYRLEIQDLKQQLLEARQSQQDITAQSSSSAVGSTSTNMTARSSTATAMATPSKGTADLTVDVSETDEEIAELVDAISTMEQLILKSSVTPPAHARSPSLPEDLLDATETSEDDDWKLLDLANGKTPQRPPHPQSYSTYQNLQQQHSVLSTPPPSTAGAPPPTSASSSVAAMMALTPDHRDNLHNELSRIQGLLGSVLKKTRQSSTANNNQVETLRQQLEWQARTTDLRKADSTFLQQQLQEKDELLQEVAQVLTALDERHQKLEAENARLRQQLAERR